MFDGQPLNTDNPFLGANFAPKLKALFYETALSGQGPLYTLKDWDWKGYPSLRRLYLEMEDVTEWKFATTYTAGWDHWNRLCEASWFKPYIARWRKELELKLRAEGLSRVIAESRNPDSKNAYQAQRFLATRGWSQGEDKPTKGRPSKADIRRAAEEMAQEDSRIIEDYARIVGNGEAVKVQ